MATAKIVSKKREILKINSFDDQNKQDYVDVDVKRENDHIHNSVLDVYRNVNPSNEDKTLEIIEIESVAKSSFVNKKIQITGDERIKIAEEIILHHNGSASAYVLYKKSKNEPVAEVDVYKKIISQFKDTDKISMDWYSNTIAASTACEGFLQSKKLNGYVQNLTTFPSFSMFCYIFKQMECIKATSYKKRILHVDATGSLVKIPLRYTKNQGTEFNRILNYFCILKNEKFIGSKEGSVQIGELISSRHDVRQIKSFFSDYKFDYEKISNDYFIFRLIVIDYS
ncbi:unnamed protein product [Brachionus calyciflorus]|uniref:Uncharacterized protein n=1 Tax=Brachionus calyciflorus TaxID=104777 RepID=A0A814Q1Q7_9BILA|nr:unnamed protein product [Brachionus calyciflorus]